MSKNCELNKSCINERYVITSIFILGFLLRLFGSIRVGFTLDEGFWMELAKKVSFSPENFNLVSHGVMHPLFEVYLIKLSTLLFDSNLFNFLQSYHVILLRTRFLHVLLSSSTIIVIYFLAKEGLGRTAAVFAALIMAFDQFHIHFSRTVIPTAPLLFFAGLSLLFFWKAVKEYRGRFIILAGFSTGLGYLCEETSLLLFGIFLVYWIIKGEFIYWLRKWETYAAILVFVIVISPDLYWKLTMQKPDINDHLNHVASLHGISLLPAMLYIGEIFIACVKDIETYAGPYGHEFRWPLQHTPMHWLTGLLCILSVVYSFRNRKNDFIKLMQVAFFFIYFFFSFFVSVGPFGNFRLGFFSLGPFSDFSFFWSSISLLPAIVLLSHMCSDLYHRNLLPKFISVGFIVYVFFHSISFLTINENVFIRRPYFLTKVYMDTATHCFLRGEISCARVNFEKTLKYEPGSVAALVNLAECYDREGNHHQEELVWENARAKGINLSESRQFYLLDKGYIKEWLINGYYNLSDLSTGKIDDLSMIKAYYNDDKNNNLDAVKSKKLISASAFVDLKKFLRNPQKTTSYVYTRIYSPLSQEVTLLLGADDEMTIWLNREEVLENFKMPLWHADEGSVKVNLIKGWNELILRVSYNQGLYYGFSIRVADSKGKIIDSLINEAF